MSILGSIGKLINNVTGVSSSAKQAQNYTQQNMATSQGMTLEQMAQSNKYTLEQMAQNYAYEVNSAKNAIKWQMDSLRENGLNPYLAAGYNGANLGGSVGATGVSGGASAPAGSTGTANGNPLEMLSNIAQMKKILTDAEQSEQSAKTLKAQEELFTSQKDKTDIESGLMPQSVKAGIRKDKATALNNEKQAELIEAKRLSEKGNPSYLIGKGIEKAEKALGRKLTPQEEKQIYQDPDEFFDELMKGKIK